jgi:hypothetical protein
MARGDSNRIREESWRSHLCHLVFENGGQGKRLAGQLY